MRSKRDRLSAVSILFFFAPVQRPLKTGRRDANQGRATQNRKCADENRL